MNGYNFTERVRRVLANAREESTRLHHEYVGTEHILLGILRESEGVAALVLQNLGLDIDALKERVEAVVGIGKSSGLGPELPYTSRAKKVLELAMAEAYDLKHSYVGTEHLLLGLSRDEQGIAAQLLDNAGARLEAIRTETLRLLGTDFPARHAGGAGQSLAGTLKAAATTWWSGNRSQRPDGPTNSYHFSERVRNVLAMAREESARLHHEYVGTEHQLLALIREGQGVAAAVLRNVGVNLAAMRQTIEDTVKQGDPARSAQSDLPYTSRAKKVLELAMTEARDLTHSYVGTEHLLLGLIREDKGIAAQLLTRAGATLDVVRAETLRLLGTDNP